MKTIAALVVTYNAEEFIRGCLKSLKDWVDEILVVDMFSSDKTVEIARRYTDKIFQEKVESHEARTNLGIDKATTDWILKVNATERIPELLREEILETVNKKSECVGYHIPRKNYICGIFMEERPGPLYLFKRGAGKYPCIGGHEQIQLKGRVGYLKNFKIHWSARTIKELIDKINRYTLQAARAVLAGHTHAFLWKKSVVRATIWNMLYRPIVGFFTIYFRRRVFRYKMHGFIFCVILTFYYFLELAHLWELQYKQEHNINDSSLPGD